MPTEEQISEVLRKFYDRVRKDDQIGPVFAVVEDWDEHLERLGEFWSSVMLMSGRYKGNPVSMHLMHAPRIRPEMFSRWLELWRITTDEILPSQSALAMQAKATRIGGRLSAAIHGRVSESKPRPASVEDAKERPYKITAEFNESTIPPALLRFHTL
ncbi:MULTISPECIES: group III truncated hemoglobin [unclassified Sinorhizobium]|uniref:group III truncated hemoglobin n=1 Tax=unclassified Sinorhizobium TaxID=2613772 RepID=UPI0035266D00